MRITLAIAVAAIAALTAPGLARAQTPKTDDEKTLYSLGFAEGQRLSIFTLSKAELELVKKGLTDSVTGAKPAVDMQVYGPKINDLARTRGEVKAKADEAKAKIDKVKGQEYADKAAKEPGAQKLPSGLIFKELKAGQGASPKDTDTVKVHYRGTLIDGTEFDSSIKRGQPAEFPLKGVVPCWTEGVQKMKVGSKAQLVCPSSIAYGDHGHPPTIPGGSTLVFEIELLEIKAPPAPTPAPTPAPAPAHGK